MSTGSGCSIGVGTSGSGGCDGTSLGDMGLDTQPITLELWFKPDASASYPANGQVLWETGGGTGLGIFYNNGVVETAHDSNAGQISADVSALTNEFIQVVVTYDTGSSSSNWMVSSDSEWSCSAVASIRIPARLIMALAAMTATTRAAVRTN